MHIQLVVESSSLIKRFFCLWGLSFLVDNDLLFDTFSNGRVLLKNLRKLKVDVLNIKHIVISHEHWDHIGGLWKILSINPQVKVYICKDSSKKFKSKIKHYKAELIEVEEIFEIKPNIFTTGQIKTNYKDREIVEQALIVKEKEGLKILTGCSHPGIVKIVSYVKEHFKQQIELIAGGFHLINESEETKKQVIKNLQDLGVKEISPYHCSGLLHYLDFIDNK